MFHPRVLPHGLTPGYHPRVLPHGLTPGYHPKVPDPGSHPSVLVSPFRIPVSLNKIDNEVLIPTPCMDIEIKRELDSLKNKAKIARKALRD